MVSKLAIAISITYFYTARSDHTRTMTRNDTNRSFTVHRCNLLITVMPRPFMWCNTHMLPMLILEMMSSLACRGAIIQV